MTLKELYMLKYKLIKLFGLSNKKSHNFYLTVEEKRELLKNNKRIPIRVKDNGKCLTLGGTVKSRKKNNNKMGL